MLFKTGQNSIYLLESLQCRIWNLTKISWINLWNHTLPYLDTLNWFKKTVSASSLKSLSGFFLNQEQSLFFSMMAQCTDDVEPFKLITLTFMPSIYIKSSQILTKGFRVCPCYIFISKGCLPPIFTHKNKF